MSDILRFNCGHCGKQLSARRHLAGRSTRCPGCQHRVTVPHPEPAPSQADNLKKSGAFEFFQNISSPSNDAEPAESAIAEPTIRVQGSAPAVELEDETPSPHQSLRVSLEPDQNISLREQPDKKSCPFCGETIMVVAKKCKHCGEFLDPVLIRARSQGEVSNSAMMPNSEQSVIRRIHDWEHLSSVMWIVLGAIQIVAGFALAGVPTAVGILNVIGAIQSRKLLPRILNRDTTIPEEYQPMVWMVLAGVYNLFLGGIIGIGLTIFDFVIRDKVLSNRQLFNVELAKAE